MRVIAGSARGIPLFAPKDRTIRPTLDRVRESLFNILAPRIPGARFLDLFAGTGANGIEALSRGAAAAVLVDENAAALDIIRKNLEKTRLAAGAVVLRGKLPEVTARLPQAPFDIIFADPPYNFENYEKLFHHLATGSLLQQNGILIIEHARKMDLPVCVAGFERTRQKIFGDTALNLYHTAHEVSSD